VLVQAPLQVPERVDDTERADQDRRGGTRQDNRKMAFRAGPERRGRRVGHRARREGIARAWTDENDKVTLFSAMLHREAVTIAQVRVPDGTNEITQAGTLLDTAGIPGGEPALSPSTPRTPSGKPRKPSPGNPDGTT